MNAILFLMQQHRQVKANLKRLQVSPDKRGLLIEIANSLSAHMAIEQNIFYPAARRADEELVIESFEEHALAELALRRLLATDPKDEAFVARVTVLRTLLERHIEEEEESLFPKVERALGKERLVTLGNEMKSSFDAAFERGYGALRKTGRTTADIAENRVLAMQNGGSR